jgi:hypothetical protein
MWQRIKNHPIVSGVVAVFLVLAAMVSFASDLKTLLPGSSAGMPTVSLPPPVTLEVSVATDAQLSEWISRIARYRSQIGFQNKQAKEVTLGFVSEFRDFLKATRQRYFAERRELMLEQLDALEEKTKATDWDSGATDAAKRELESLSVLLEHARGQR